MNRITWLGILGIFVAFIIAYSGIAVMNRRQPQVMNEYKDASKFGLRGASDDMVTEDVASYEAMKHIEKDVIYDKKTDLGDDASKLKEGMLKTHLEDTLEIARDVVKEGAEKVTGAVCGAVEKTKEAATCTVGSLKKAVPASKLMAESEEMAKSAAEMAKEAVKGTVETTVGVASVAGEKLREIATDTVEMTKKAAAKTAETLSEGVELAKEAVPSMEGTKEFVKSAAEKVASTASAAGETLKETAVEATAFTAEKMRETGEVIKETAKEATAFTAEKMRETGEVIKETAMEAVNLAAGAGEKVMEGAEWGKEKVKKVASEASELVSEAKDKAEDLVAEAAHMMTSSSKKKDSVGSASLNHDVHPEHHMQREEATKEDHRIATDTSYQANMASFTKGTQDPAKVH